MSAACVPEAPPNGPSGSQTCPAGESCISEVSVTDGTTTASASFGPGEEGSTLVVTIHPADDPGFSCPDYPRTPETVVSEFHFTGGDASDRSGYFVSSFPSPDSEPYLGGYRVCWAAPYPFLQEDFETPAVVQGLKPGTGDPLYVGLLPNCNVVDDDDLPAPCVDQRWYDSETGLIHIAVYTTGADPWRY